MTREGIAKASIALAGVATATMGAFHFALPALFGWGRFTQTLPPQIQWALFALNAFFSFLLLAGGLATMATLFLNRANAGPFWTMILFWTFNAMYQLVRPFPAPPRIRWVLLGFSVAVATLYGIGAWRRRSGCAQPRSLPAV